jgi:hypothetical protein
LPDTGTYDLRITNATYDRDNGQFECRVKEGGTGRVLHTKSFDLTVLLPPSPPQVSILINLFGSTINALLY